MLPSELVSKPLHKWTVDDLKLIVERQSEESQFLEFKGVMTLKDGALGWNDKGKIHDSERDGLAKEIVAFANAYGGHLIVGIKESEENPRIAGKLAEPHSNAIELAERLRSALKSIIDPPINGLRIQPINADESGRGYLAIEIPQSIHAPHGFGNPPSAFVRRADRSEPMTMRDLQNVFWEARTRRERIESELSKFSNRFAEYSFEANRLAFGFVAVSEDSVELPDIWKFIRDKYATRLTGNFPSSLFDTGTLESCVEHPSNSYKWSPNARGANYRYSATSQFDGKVEEGVWAVDDGGIVSLIGNKEGYRPRDGTVFGGNTNEPQIRFDQREIVGALKQFLDLVRIVSYASVSFPRRWIIQGYFRTIVAPVFVVSHTGDWGRVNLSKGVQFRPIEIDLVERVVWPDYLTRRVWESFETAVPENQLGSLGKLLSDHWSQWDFS